MARFLFGFGLIIFAGCFIFFIMNFFTDAPSGTGFIIPLFGMLNAGVAMGVSDILMKMERPHSQ